MKIQFKLNKSMDENQKRFLVESLERAELFSKIDIENSELLATLKSESLRKDAINTFEQLSELAVRMETDILFESSYSATNKTNIMKQLLESGQIIEIDTGSFIIQGEFLRLMKELDSKLVEFAMSLNGQEQYYPVLWPIDLFKKINYFKEFPQNLLIATHVKKEHDTLSNFSKEYDNKNEFDQINVADHMAPVTKALGPSTCDPCYYALKGCKEVKNQVYFALNKSFRAETSKTNALDRLTEFTMREVIAVGTQEFILNTRNKFIEFSIGLLESFELESKIESANDPFFTNDSILKAEYQKSFQSKYELNAKLDNNSPLLAIGSINYHGDHFGRAFSLQNGGEKFGYSSCLAFGLERFIYAYLTQNGMISKKLQKKPNKNQTAVDKKSISTQNSTDFSKLDKKIHSEVLVLLSSSFGNHDYSSELSQEVLKAWDSIGHLKLITSLEAHFKLKLKNNDIQSSYRDIIALTKIIQKTRAK